MSSAAVSSAAAAAAGACGASAGGGAGPPSAAAANAALAPPAAAAAAVTAADAPAGSVFVKRSGDARARFARVPILVGDAVTDLAERASLKLDWRTSSAFVELLVVRTDRARSVECGNESEGVGDALFSGDKLVDVGVVDGVFLLARLLTMREAAAGGGGGGGGVGAGAAAGASTALGAESQWTSNRLRASLVEAGIAVDESFVRRVIGSRALQNALAFCSSAADLAIFHEMAMRDPQSETRAAVLSESGIAIGGDIDFPHRTTALFKWAFDGAVPCVLKLPQGAGAAERECRLYRAVGSAARDAGIHLVPVRRLRLSGRHCVGTDVSNLHEGVLMPSYPVTLAQASVSLIKEHGVRILARLEAAIDFLGTRGWVHGDLKPSNVFLDSSVEPWLGDFGSSFEIVDAAAAFSGGTPSFQVEGVAPDAPDAAFDRAALVVSLIRAAGLLEAGSRDGLPWPASVLRAALTGLAECAALQAALSSSLGRALSANAR